MTRSTSSAREVVVSAASGDGTAPRRVTSPLGSEPIVIDDARLLQQDEHGVLFVNVAVGELGGGKAGQDLWRLESAGLEVRGRTPAEDGAR